MAQSITLQTSDSDIIASDILGRIAFAASSETSGSDAILIGGGIYAEAESAFTAVSNATSLVFATASSESATGKLKITSDGHLLPLLNNTYDIGSSSFIFRNLYLNSGIFNGTIIANSIAGNASSNNVVDGRLTIYTGDPIGSEVGNTFGNTLYFTPFNGNRISLYDTTNSRWQIHTFSEISISLASGYAANTMYDVFIHDNAGTKTLELTAWTTQGGYASPTATASARSTGSVLALQDGVYVKSGSSNKRYLGTVRTNATAGYISDGSNQRFLWNMYNRVSKSMSAIDSTSHTYATGTFRLYRNQSSNIVEFIVGIDRHMDLKMTILSSTVVNPVSSIPVGIGIDATNGVNSNAITNNVDTASLRTGSSDFITNLLAGYHYLAMVQYGATGATFSNSLIEATTQC